MIRIAGLALGLALLGLPMSASVAADRDVTVSNRDASERVVVKRRYHRGRHYGCPDGYGCYPLYGAYGPYGGRAYWSSFSYIVPTYSDQAVVRSRW